MIHSVMSFSKFTNYACSCDEILKSENEILKILKWKIQFLNLHFWLNLITSQWDEFSEKFLTHILNLNCEFMKYTKFRNLTNETWESFSNIVIFFQLIDIISLDFLSLKYSYKLIVCSIVYLLIGLEMKFFCVSETQEFQKNIYFYSKFHELNIIFNSFLMKYHQLELSSLSEHIRYVSIFFNVKFDEIHSNHTEKERRVRQILYFKIF